MMQLRKSKQLDYVLVPLGQTIMVSYHAWLLLRIQRRPATTVIGINAINRRIWVRHIMEEPSGKHAVLAVQTMRNSIMASTVLASVVAALMASGVAHSIFSAGGGGASAGQGQGQLVVGAASETTLSIKFFTILICFLVAFLLNVQSIRYYSHTGFLVNVPLQAHRLRRPGLAVDYVTAGLNRGSYFWSLGIRAFYFSCPVFLWLFGPIPMFAACLSMSARSTSSTSTRSGTSPTTTRKTTSTTAATPSNAMNKPGRSPTPVGWHLSKALSNGSMLSNAIVCFCVLYILVLLSSLWHICFIFYS